MIDNIENIIDLTGSNQFKKLYRVNYNGLRLYLQEEPFKYYSGLTGALGAATFMGDPEKKALKRWRDKMIDSFGKANTDDYVTSTADFGSLLHQALVRIKENGKIVWAEETDIAENYFFELFKSQGREEMGSVIKSMSYEYCKHVASLMQFVYDRVEKIHAIEVPAIWEELKIATPIDLVASCRQTPKGDHKMTTINIKTSSQLSASHLEQVSAELHMWNSTYDIECECTGLIRTTDWKEASGPTYQYKGIDVLEAMEISQDAFSRLNLCLKGKASYYPEPSSKYFKGECKPGEKPDVVIQGLKDEWLDYWSTQKVLDGLDPK